MRRSLSLLCSVLFCSSLWAEDYIPFSQPTWTKENPKTALYIMPRSIDREDRDQSYLMVLVDSWGDGWNGASVDVTINNDETLLTGLTITSGNEAAFEVMRVPVAPKGCPKAMAPPSIFTISGLILSSFKQAID